MSPEQIISELERVNGCEVLEYLRKMGDQLELLSAAERGKNQQDQDPTIHEAAWFILKLNHFLSRRRPKVELGKQEAILFRRVIDLLKKKESITSDDYVEFQAELLRHWAVDRN